MSLIICNKSSHKKCQPCPTSEATLVYIQEPDSSRLAAGCYPRSSSAAHRTPGGAYSRHASSPRGVRHELLPRVPYCCYPVCSICLRPFGEGFGGVWWWHWQRTNCTGGGGIPFSSTKSRQQYLVRGFWIHYHTGLWYTFVWDKKRVVVYNTSFMKLRLIGPDPSPPKQLETHWRARGGGRGGGRKRERRNVTVLADPGF